MPKYTLYYFDIPGRAEIIRLIFAASGVEFTDYRFSETNDEWTQKKPGYTFKQCPVLDIDGKQLAQSYSIARYLANEFGLNGETNYEKFLNDQVVDAIKDEVDFLIQFCFFEEDKTRVSSAVKKFKKERLPSLLDALEGLVKNGFFSGNKMRWGDIAFFDFCDNVIRMFGLTSSDALGNGKHPKLKTLYDAVSSYSNIAEFIKKRKPFSYPAPKD